MDIRRMQEILRKLEENKERDKQRDRKLEELEQEIREIRESNKSLAEAVATGEIILNAADNIAPRLAIRFSNDESEVKGLMLIVKSGQAVGLKGKNGKVVFIVPKWLALAMKKRGVRFQWIVAKERLSCEQLYEKIDIEGKVEEELESMG